MTKPLYQLVLMTIENPRIKGETFEHEVFKKQLSSLLNLINKIETTKVPSTKAQFQFTLTKDFECLLRLLVTVENSFWYQYLLKTQLPELYERLIERAPKCRDIEISEDFTPRLLYNELCAANEKRPDSKLSELIFTIYNVMYFSETTLTTIQAFKKASLSNLKLISAIEQCGDRSDLKKLERRFAENLVLLTKRQ